MKVFYTLLMMSCISLIYTYSSNAHSEAPTKAPIESSALYKFEQICDGSAAVRLNNTHLLVANDETNDVYVFPNTGGPPTASRDLPTTQLVQDSKKEMDIEGMAIVDQTIWWIGSHGSDGDGDDSPNRRSLFATNIPTQDLNAALKVESGPIDLTRAFTNDAELEKHLTAAQGKKAKKGGVNIEGLAPGPVHAGEPGISLIVGFRSPLTDRDLISGNAILANIVGDGKQFAVKKVWKLNLGDRGVRDIIKSGDSYIILAGDVDTGGSFALYQWDGKSDAVELMEPLLDLGTEVGFEAVIDMDTHWLVLADDGSVKRPQSAAGGKSEECKESLKSNDAPRNVYFRGQDIPKK